MVRKISTRILSLVAVFWVLVSSYHWLPVYEVWFGNKQVAVGQLTTPAKWQKVLQSWDWVDGYSLQWVYPGVLRLSVKSKEAFATQPDGSYIALDASVYHWSGQKLLVPVLDVKSDSIPNAVSLLRQLQEECGVAAIKEYASGSVEVLFETGDIAVLPGMHDNHVCWKMIQRAKPLYPGKSVHCDLRHQRYASCDKR